MWAMKLNDGNPGIIYLRENLLDGRVLVFRNEESALRLMRQISKHVYDVLGVRMQTVRSVPDGVLGRLVGDAVVSERGVAQITQQPGSVTWLTESKVANLI